ncbi:battenin-like [Homarus americanus]|uniref:battenin-like n=1 Tax=Homarus americanus TaxID=6706 RepID=UPI001C48E2F3|nr:battenin-like [Homarus americanus]XP_042218052.1 battenin-like [Homarus americanus]
MAPGPYDELLPEGDLDHRQCLLEDHISRLPRVTPSKSTEHIRAEDQLLLQDQPDDSTITDGHRLLTHSAPHHTSHSKDDPPTPVREGGKGSEGTKGRDEKKNNEREGREKEGKEKDGDGEEYCSKPRSPPRSYRDLVAYWLLGFCNNFTYWVMITAAYDLLSAESQSYTERAQHHPHHAFLRNLSDVTTYSPSDIIPVLNESADTFISTFKCLRHSTGAILVADTLPGTALTIAAPLTLLVSVNVRVWLIGSLCVASYLTLGLAASKFVFLGVALASASRGFSDTTFLGHASHYHKHVLSLWSSGTGVATFMGPLLYSSMTTAGLDPRHSLLVFLTVPALIAISFWCVLSQHKKEHEGSDVEVQEAAGIKYVEDMENEKQKRMVLVKEKFFLFLRAQKYLLPLAVFYFVMYITNQGLLELVYFPASHLTHAQQYSWSNTIRCLGTLISRSAHKLLLLSNTWICSILAMVILVVVGMEAHYHYLPSEYIVFTLLFLQGLLEGAAFRSTIFNMHKKAIDKEREFCLGIFPVSLFLPAMLAGFTSIPIHDVLCQNHLYRQ